MVPGPHARPTAKTILYVVLFVCLFVTTVIYLRPGQFLLFIEPTFLLNLYLFKSCVYDHSCMKNYMYVYVNRDQLQLCFLTV